MENLLPIIKWKGGKRKEIKHFKHLIPDLKNYTYIEPFMGGGALYFHLNHTNSIINDFDSTLVNFYKAYQNNSEYFISTLNEISKIKEHRALEAEYYRHRDIINSSGVDSDNLAISFYVVNQLAFSGMRRFNREGKFNVPFGHYNQLPINLINSEKHHNLLKATTIKNEDFESVIVDEKNTFVFLDPPYTRVFNEYSAENVFDNTHQIRLANVLKSLNHSQFIMIINKDEFTSELYKDYIKSSYGLKYSSNIRNRYNTNTEHLIITNY